MRIAEKSNRYGAQALQSGVGKPMQVDNLLIRIDADERRYLATPMRNRRSIAGSANRRGFALQSAVIMTLFFVISVSVGLTITDGEQRAAVDRDAHLKASVVAQNGVERYLVDVTTPPTAFPDARTIAASGGTATVTMRAVRTNIAHPEQNIYVLTAVGHAAPAKLTWLASASVAEESVSQFVTWQGGWRRVQNSWADNWPSYTVP